MSSGRNIQFINIPHHLLSACLWGRNAPRSESARIKQSLVDAQYYYSKAENIFHAHFSAIKHEVSPGYDEIFMEYLLNDGHQDDVLNHHDDNQEIKFDNNLLQTCMDNYLKAIDINYELLSKNAEVIIEREVKEQLFFCYTHLAYCYALKNDLTQSQSYIEKSLLIYDAACEKSPHIENKHRDVAKPNENPFTIKWIAKHIEAFKKGHETIDAYLHLAEILKHQPPEKKMLQK